MTDDQYTYWEREDYRKTGLDNIVKEQARKIIEQRRQLAEKDARIAELRKIGFRTAGYTFQLYIHLRNKGNDVLANEVYEIWQQAERTLESETKS